MEEVEAPAVPAIGVEILEMSVTNLNPNNIRRIYTSSSRGRRKDVVVDGALGGNVAAISSNSVGIGNNAIEGGSLADADEAEEKEEKEEVVVMEGKSVAVRATSEGDDDVVDDPDYARDHPANQYAWLEEMRLRIHGRVPFGIPMERANPISRWMYGNAYRQSIPSSPTIGTGRWYLRWLWRPWAGGRSDGDGVDGEGECVLYGADDGRNSRRGKSAAPNRASNKP